MTLSPMVLVGGIGMIAVAIGFCGYALVRRLGVAYLALGMAAWVVTVAVKVALALPLNGPSITLAESLSQPWRMIVLFLYGGVMTGATEVAIVWAVLRYTRLGRASWPQVLAFGIGFGAIEALLLGIGSLTAASLGLLQPDNMPVAIMETLAKADNLVTQLAPIWERFFTCLGHLATNVMVFYAVATRQARWFWAGFWYKSAIDGVATIAIVEKYIGATSNIWILEGIVAVWALVGMAVTRWISMRYPSAPAAAEFLPSESPATELGQSDLGYDER